MSILKHRKLTICILTYLLLAVGMSVSYAQKRNKKAAVQAAEPLPGAAEEHFLDGLRFALTEDYSSATASLEKSLRIDPKNAAAHYKLAEIYLSQEQWQPAILHAKEALSLDKDNQWYFMMLAETYLRSGNVSEAAATVENMLNKTAASPLNYLKLAQLYLQLNEPDNALDALNKAEKSLGIDEHIIDLKQRLYLEQNKLAEAIAEGEKLIAHYPGNSAYSLRQAQLLLNVQRYADAQAYLLQYLTKHPDDPQARFLLAKTYEAQELYSKANEELLNAFTSPELAIEPKLQEMAQLISLLPNKDLEKSLQQLTGAIITAHPEDSRAHAIAGDYFIAVDKKQAARQAYKRALEIDESNFSIWQNALSLGLELGRYDSVAQEAEQALVLFPNQAALYYFSGSANLALDNYSDAVLALEQGKKLSVANKQLTSIFNSHLGDAYHGLKRYQLSDAAYEAALAFNPNNDYILNNYSYYLAVRNDKLPLALNMSKKLVEQHPQNANYLDTYAWVLYRMGEYNKAKLQLEKALQYATEGDGTILEHYGDVLYQLGKKDEAVQQWQKAKQKKNTSVLLDKKIQDRKLYE